MAWLQHEISGYKPGGGPLTRAGVIAAERSSRLASTEGGRKYWTGSLGQLQIELDDAVNRAAALSAAPASSSEYAVIVERNKAEERNALSKKASHRRELIDKVVGSFHRYVVERHQELRFGSAVETAFEVVRERVDASIHDLVPAALVMLTGAFASATSGYPEHWANAASTCRRLLKEVADVLEPPREEYQTTDGKTIRMGEANYINRLVHWIREQADSETTAGMIAADLEYLGRRLDASDQAGQKGAHSHVTRFEASRYITGTYLVLGDILDLATPSPETDRGEPSAAA